MRFLADLIAIATATVVLLLTIAFLPDGPVRIVLGFPFVLFFPGYALIAMLYARRADLDGIDRLALSLGLSLAVVPLIGLVLNYTSWGIRLVPVVVSLMLFTTACSVVAGAKRARLPESERFPADVRPILTGLRRLPWPTIGISAAVVGMLLFAGFRFGVLGPSRVGEPFTEFYVLGPSGKAEGYPDSLFRGQAAEVILEVINHEEQDVDYSIEIRSRGQLLQRIGSFRLGNTQKWREKVSLALRGPGDRVEVEFLLFRSGTSAPYRSLHLWVRVRPL